MSPDSAFTAAILPVLHDQCAGCHFAGGPMYKDLPFDDQATVARLGDAVMVQLEGKGQERMRQWLALVRRRAQEPDGPSSAP